MLASISTKYWHYLLSQGLVLGIGLGSGFVSCIACVSSYYKRKRGLANGLLSSGSAVGGLVIPIYVSKMIDNPKIGLKWAHRTSGFICFLLVGIGCLLMKQKKTPPNKRPLFDFAVFKQPAYAFTATGLFMVTLGIFVGFSYLLPTKLKPFFFYAVSRRLGKASLPKAEKDCYQIFYIQPFAVSKGVSPGLAFYSIAILSKYKLSPKFEHAHELNRWCKLIRTGSPSDCVGQCRPIQCPRTQRCNGKRE